MAILICDQVTKAGVRASLDLGKPVALIPGLIRLTLVHNTGAAFGLFPGGRPVFVLMSLLVLFVIAGYWRRAQPVQWPVVIALAMIAGGSVGNLIDRALLGQVTDFFEFTFLDFPVFNIADTGIVGGVAVLMAWILLGPQSAEDHEPEVAAASQEGPAPEAEAGGEPAEPPNQTEPGPSAP